MSKTDPVDTYETPSPDAAWDERDVAGRHGMLAGILAQVSAEALQGETLDDVLRRIVDCVTRRLPVAIASIILLDEDCTHFVKEVWSGELNLELPDGESWPVATGAAGRCARSGEAQLIADVSRDPDYVAGNPEVKSEYLVPIRHRDRLHGVLNLESTRAGFFTPEVRATFDAIAAQVAGAVHLARVVSELEAANRRLEQLSMSDGLTGIANRRRFDARLEEAWREAAGNGAPLALLLVDVDCFKALNDALGHLDGDECLRRIAGQCAAHACSANELVARVGGEEFALLLPACAEAEACRRADVLRCEIEALGLAHPASTVGPWVTVSIGVAALTADAVGDGAVLVAIADRALYAAKRGGRNRVVALGEAAAAP